jgi:hypothetical protein
MRKDWEPGIVAATSSRPLCVRKSTGLQTPAIREQKKIETEMVLFIVSQSSRTEARIVCCKIHGGPIYRSRSCTVDGFQPARGSDLVEDG